MHTDAELKQWERYAQSRYRLGELSPQHIRCAERAGLVWRDARPEVTKETCIAEIKRVAKQLGKAPTQNGFKKHASISYTTVIKYCGSWNKALTAAGLVINNNMSITKREVIAELKKVTLGLGHAPTRYDFNKHASFGLKPVDRLFGTWNKGLKAAGLVINRSNAGSTKTQALTEVKRIAKLLQHTPTHKEFDKHASISYMTVVKLFGSWNGGLKAAHLVLNITYGITKTQVLTEIKRVEKLLGHTPIKKEFIKYSDISPHIVKRRFGSWNKGLQTAGLVLHRNYGTTKAQMLAELKRVTKQLGHTPTTVEFYKYSSNSLSIVQRLFGTWNKGLKAAGLVLNHSNTGSTKTQVLEELRRVAKVLGHTPTAKEFTQYASITVESVKKVYGSWNKGLMAAGLVINVAYGITKEVCIAEIRRVAKLLGRAPKMLEFNKHASIRHGVVFRQLGSWNKGLKAAGLTSSTKQN